jgi:hypothetical protein
MSAGSPGAQRGPSGGKAGRRKARLQALAFALIPLASAGLYFTSSQGATAGTWALLGIEAAAMLLALWIS